MERIALESLTFILKYMYKNTVLERELVKTKWPLFHVTTAGGAVALNSHTAIKLYK